MLGKLLFTGPLLGIVYLAIIMWWLSGYTPIDLINAITDTVNQLLTEPMEIVSSINF